MLLDLLDRGVAGFSPKSSNGAVIEAVLRLIAAGGRYLPPRLAEIAASRVDLHGASAFAPVADQPPKYRLSIRQSEVMRLLGEGYFNKEIAKQLGLAPSTVKTPVLAVLAALGVKNRTEAAIKARAF